jgi:alpha-tubulin suppressor-like RCC1 family protein
VIINLDGNVLVFSSNNNGQLGLGDTINRNTPTQIPNIKANQVSAGDNIKNLSLQKN